jgi:hypothetical protein
MVTFQFSQIDAPIANRASEGYGCGRAKDTSHLGIGMLGSGVIRTSHSGRSPAILRRESHLNNRDGVRPSSFVMVRV